MNVSQAEIHHVSQLFDNSSAISTTYLGRIEISREDAFKAQEQFSLTDQSITVGTLTKCYRLQNTSRQ